MKTILKSQTNLLRLVKVWQKDKLKLTISNCGRDTHTRIVAAMTAFVRMKNKETPIRNKTQRTSST